MCFFIPFEKFNSNQYWMFNVHHIYIELECLHLPLPLSHSCTICTRNPFFIVNRSSVRWLCKLNRNQIYTSSIEKKTPFTRVIRLLLDWLHLHEWFSTKIINFTSDSKRDTTKGDETENDRKFDIYPIYCTISRSNVCPNLEIPLVFRLLVCLLDIDDDDDDDECVCEFQRGK